MALAFDPNRTFVRGMICIYVFPFVVRVNPKEFYMVHGKRNITRKHRKSLMAALF